MISVRSSSKSLKCERFTPSGCKDIGIREYEFISQTNFILNMNLNPCSTECSPSSYQDCNDIVKEVPYLSPEEQCEEVPYEECVEVGQE